MLSASGVASTHIGHPSVIPHRARRCRPTQLSSQQKCILCDRHHTASAMAELACYLSIVPHMRSFDVPPKHSAPLTRGLFCAARLSASRTKKAPPGSGAQVGTPWMWTLAFERFNVHSRETTFAIGPFCLPEGSALCHIAARQFLLGEIVMVEPGSPFSQSLATPRSLSNAPRTASSLFCAPATGSELPKADK